MADPKPIQMMPGGGWRIVFAASNSDADEYVAYSSPVLAWVLYDDGSVYPVDVDSDGCAEILDHNSLTSNLIGIQKEGIWEREPGFDLEAQRWAREQRAKGRNR